MKQPFDLGHSVRDDARDRRAVRRQFDRRSDWPDPAAFLLREVGGRMLERLDLIRSAPERILDVGCGFGDDARALALRYPSASVMALDFSLPRLKQARAAGHGITSGGWWQALRTRLQARASPSPEPVWLSADAHALPIASHQLDLVWSNLAVHWFDDVPVAIGEWYRVIRPGGLVMFSALGVDCLHELQPLGLRLPRLPDMHDLGDALVHAGFSDPVMDTERLQLSWQDPQRMLDDLRSLGGDVRPHRPAGLFTAHARQALVKRLRALCGPSPKPVTIELVQGHAWCPPVKRLAQGWAPITLTPRGAGS